MRRVESFSSFGDPVNSFSPDSCIDFLQSRLPYLAGLNDPFLDSLEKKGQGSSSTQSGACTNKLNGFLFKETVETQYL